MTTDIIVFVIKKRYSLRINLYYAVVVRNNHKNKVAQNESIWLWACHANYPGHIFYRTGKFAERRKNESSLKAETMAEAQPRNHAASIVVRATLLDLFLDGVEQSS